MRIGKMMVIIVTGLLLVATLGNSVYSGQEVGKQKPVKIIWKSEDITEKVYPAMAKGKVYVIDSAFFKEVRSYSTVTPMFMKNDVGKWTQLGLRFGIENPTKHQHIVDIRIYTDSNRMRITDLSGIGIFDLQVPSVIAKEKYGEVYYIEEEGKWVSEHIGQSYKTDKVVFREQGEYFLHYIPLEDVVTVLNLKLTHDQETNVITLSP